MAGGRGGIGRRGGDRPGGGEPCRSPSSRRLWPLRVRLWLRLRLRAAVRGRLSGVLYAAADLPALCRAAGRLHPTAANRLPLSLSARRGAPHLSPRRPSPLVQLQLLPLAATAMAPARRGADRRPGLRRARSRSPAPAAAPSFP